MIPRARQKLADPPAHQSFTPLETFPQEGMFPDSLAPFDAGMMVLSSSMHILHINGRARTLLSRFGVAYDLWPHVSPESMPTILTEFCATMLSELHRHTGSQEWTALELRRICHMVTPALLLRGFAVPETDGQDPRMILILQPCHS